MPRGNFYGFVHVHVRLFTHVGRNTSFMRAVVDGSVLPVRRLVAERGLSHKYAEQHFQTNARGGAARRVQNQSVPRLLLKKVPIVARRLHREKLRATRF